MQHIIESTFLSAMIATGIAPCEKIIADGRLHRFRVQEDRPGTRNGWYILFLDGVSSGTFGSWKTGSKYSWCAKNYHELTAIERAENKRRVFAARKARELEEEALHNAARNKAAFIWQAAVSASDNHPYLLRKGVKNHGLHLYKSSLVIPLRDSDGILNSLQFIDTEGNKRFLSGGRKRGCYFSIGQPNGLICIAEGYATAASVHEATGYAVAIAFDAGNLQAVAEALRKKFPTANILICADNDLNTPGNPGLTKAREAAATVNGLIAVAEF